MSKKQELIQPGRPGDVLEILRHGHARIDDHRKETEFTTSDLIDHAFLEVVAATTIRALRMWLGEIPVARMTDNPPDEETSH